MSGLRWPTVHVRGSWTSPVGCGACAGMDSAWKQNAKRQSSAASAYHPSARARRFVSHFPYFAQTFEKTDP
jgi:hypothetical protein